MAIPEYQTIELRAHRYGLSAWVNGKRLGQANVVGDEVIITAQARHVIAGSLTMREAAIGNVTAGMNETTTQ